MLVVFGANGRTGAAIVAEALQRGMTVRAIVRDDRDVDGLPTSLGLESISYADPTAPRSLPAVLQGATQVISCIDPRTSGPGCVVYPGEAAEHIVNASADAGAVAILHVSIMGAYRWAYTSLNRKAFYLEGGVRNCNAPWAILRVSCYHDEVIEGHIAPPDGGKPSPFKKSSRYSPVSRTDAARMILDHMKNFKAGRSPCIGGPEVFTGSQLAESTQRWLKPGKGKKTTYAGLPPGDVSVAPHTTRQLIGWIPETRINDALENKKEAPKATEAGPVYANRNPQPHTTDRGKSGAGLDPLNVTLRRIVHTQLAKDLNRVAPNLESFSLCFSNARRGKHKEEAHDGTMYTYGGVRALGGQDQVLYKGKVNFLRDELAEVFFCWWDTGEIPQNVWDQLNMGVRRRLRKNRRFAGDPRVETSRSGAPEQA
jgi:uncharacterized protein YbjT (DUF2867 family)